MGLIREIVASMDYGPAPEANDHVLAWLDSHEGEFGHFIGGRFTRPGAGGTIEVFDPARETLLARVALGTREDVDGAVAAARRALKSWSASPGHVRATYLYAIARHIQKRERFFAVLESMDNGKPIRETRDIDVPLVARHFTYHAGWAELVESEFPGRGPVGVCGQIIPWNFPLLMLAWKVAPALAAGNTVVLKPAEYTPLTALAFAEICAEVGLPPGVVNIVTGDGTSGDAIVCHPDVDKIAFTGSTATGREVVRMAAGTLKSVTTELGGKNPLIVFDDADLDKAMAGALVGAFLNQGEACIASSRLMLHESIHDAFVEKLVERAAKIKVGPALDYDTRLGALISRTHLERVESFIEAGKDEGARLLCGGERPRGDEYGDGYYLTPAVFTDVTPTMRIAQEEIFGPVVSVMKFRAEEEALAVANGTMYGLVSAVFTQDITRALRVARRLQSGTVWVNAYGYLRTEAPFGGYKQSGQGRELSAHALEHYTRIKNVYVDLEAEQICFYE